MKTPMSIEEGIKKEKEADETKSKPAVGSLEKFA